VPIGTGVLDYFPKALAEIAKVSKAGNDQHNPGQPLHWSKHKSADHYDCLVRHSIERGTWDYGDVPPQRHSAKLAWRALALLETELEAETAGMSVRDYVEKLKRDANPAVYAKPAPVLPADASVCFEVFSEMVIKP
jgi:hypothetical protein